MKKPYLIGITGGSASGKTHVLKTLRNIFSEDELCIISQDNYYKPYSEQQTDENGHLNFDLPSCIYLDELARDLKALGNQEIVNRKEYLFQVVGVEPAVLTFKPAPIIVCEGLFVFYYAEIFNQFDLKIFVNADESIALQRRLKRDVAERNIDEDFVIYQWKNHVMPAYQNYLLPFMAQADLIINNNTHMDNSIEILENHFRAVLGGK